MSSLLTRLRHALRRLAVGDPPPPPAPPPPALLQRVELSAVVCAGASFPVTSNRLSEGFWLASSDPGEILYHVRNCASPRKLRLYCVACCRALLGPWLGRDWCGPGLDVAQRYAEGLAADEQREQHRRRAEEAHNYLADLDRTQFHIARRGEMLAASAVMLALAPDGDESFATACRCSRDSAAAPAHLAFRNLPTTCDEQERNADAVQCELARELFGNPFRPVKIDPTWLVVNDGAAAGLARTIYQEQRFGEMSILADALEEAGCTDEAILAHCRSGAGHVLGCWLLDALLGQA
jgi:hypothetical protein